MVESRAVYPLRVAVCRATSLIIWAKSKEFTSSGGREESQCSLRELCKAHRFLIIPLSSYVTTADEGPKLCEILVDIFTGKNPNTVDRKIVLSTIIRALWDKRAITMGIAIVAIEVRCTFPGLYFVFDEKLSSRTFL